VTETCEWCQKFPGQPHSMHQPVSFDLGDCDEELETYVRPTFDAYFLDIAQAVSARADCRRRRHGAAIVTRNRIVATGYNGSAAGKPGCLAGACPRGLLSYTELPPLTSYDEGPGFCVAVHAEQNALLYSSRADVEGGTIYITGEPCATCRRLIGGSGLVRAVWPGGGYNV
jgi:dCMP deaminase